MSTTAAPLTPTETPTGWLTARIRINVNRKNDGPGATPYGVLHRILAVPTLPAMPDHIDIDVLGHRLAIKTRPLGWDAERHEYVLADMTLVLLAAEIANLHKAEPTAFHPLS